VRSGPSVEQLIVFCFKKPGLFQWAISGELSVGMSLERGGGVWRRVVWREWGRRRGR